MLVYEIVLMPLIYIRFIYLIMKVESNILQALLLCFAWLMIGPFYLLHGFFKDMYYYFKVLFDYHEDDTVGAEQDQEDILQDRIVIFNEVIDTMRAIMNIFKYESGKLLKKKKLGPGG